MTSRPIILPVVLLAACTAGPESPERYRRFGPVTTLSFNFKDAPPEEEIELADLIVNLVSFLHTVDAPSSECDEHAANVHLKPFVANGARFQIPSIRTASVDNLSEACAQRHPEALHFLKVHAELAPKDTGGGGMVSMQGSWTPGAYDLVYARALTTFKPFGPSGPAATIPEGYWWLRRSCGAGGNTEMSVVPISETLDLQPGKQMFAGPTGTRAVSEIIERELATACGGQLPVTNPGARVSFDRAKEILWSADGASLFYLSPDVQDPNGAVGIRQVKLLEQTTRDLAVVNHASALQTGATGVLYVTADANTYALSMAPGVPATVQALPFTGSPHLSPDGLWFAYDGVGGVHLWSVPAAAETATLPGSYFAWSPDSRLLAGPPPSSVPYQAALSPYPLSAVPPTAPDRAVSCGALSDLLKSNGHLAWQSECPQVAYAPQSWSIDSTITYPACKNCFGVSLQDPATGDERPVLDASAGLVHLVDTHPVAGFTFAWARTCQGLYNTICTHSLLRIRLADGAVETIATAEQEMPVALSWDNRRLALAAANGIYVTELPQ